MNFKVRNNSPYHSLSLRKHFTIQRIGVDFITQHKVKVEFKETFSEKQPKDIIFKIASHQFLESELFVFCFNNSEFYIHKAMYLKFKYYKENNCGLVSIRASSLRKNYIWKTNNYTDLKHFLDNFHSEINNGDF